MWMALPDKREMVLACNLKPNWGDDGAGYTVRLPRFNNEAEYEAYLAGIDLVIFVSSEKIIIQSDSQLVVGQVNGEYKTRDQRMAKYVCLVKLRLESIAA